MVPNNDFGLVVLITTLLGLIFKPELAGVLAPHVVIVVGGLIGTGWGLKRRVEKGGTFWFIVLMLGSAFVFTMPAAFWLQRYLGENTAQWFLAPIAVVIGAVGEDWTRIGKWAFSLFRRRVELKADAPTKSDVKE